MAFILHQPEISILNGRVMVQARFESPVVPPEFPQALWFSFPEQFAAYVTSRTDAFALSLLLPAMRFGEDLEVRGETSAKLAYGLHELMRLFAVWYPDSMQKVSLKFKSLPVLVPASSQQAVVSAFSGGVDSFYTVRQHLPQSESNPIAQLTHLLYIEGFNLPLSENEHSMYIKSQFLEAAKSMGLELIPAATNISEFRPWVSWLSHFHSALIGTPLVLGNLVRRYYVPSSFNYRDLQPYGSSPLTDYLMSTESLDVVHHGAYYSRIEKIERIADWEIAQKYLRVCDSNRVSSKTFNCCQCEKCLRTMAMLKVVGGELGFDTLRPQGDLKIFLQWGLHYSLDTLGVSISCKYAFKQRSYKFLPWLWLTYLIGMLKGGFSLITPNIILNPIKKLIYR